MKFNDEITINGNKLTRKFIEGLTDKEREVLIEPIFNFFRANGFIYPDEEEKLNLEYKRLCNTKLDLNAKEIYNNNSIGTFICKYFCKSFYNATERGKKNMIELFNDDDALKKVIRNRLGLEWYKKLGEDDLEAFQISYRQILQGFRSSRQISMISIFKPIIARFIYEKYSNPEDLIYDYSAGFGGRLLGAKACNRRYLGIDPLTSKELNIMKDYFNFKDCNIYKAVSENFCLQKDSIDLAFSSPPYYDQEYYSSDITQAYNKGEDYFYNTYWKNTLSNIYYMLKPNKHFILNVKNFPKMVEMTKEVFTFKEELLLRTVKSHLNKKGKEDAQKYESVYVFTK